MPDAFDQAEAGELDAFDRAAAQGDVFDLAAGDVAAPVDDLPPGEHVGKWVGRYLADPNNSPSARALDSLGFDATQRQWIKDDPADWLAGDITAEDVAAKAVPAAALAAGLATGGAGPAAALALGVGGGGAARAGAAWLRGQDVSDAVLDPKAVAWDVGLSGIPLALQGAKAGGTALWNAAPSSVREPLVRGATRVADSTLGLVEGGLNRAANWAARRGPRYGEQIIDDTPLTIDDIMARRPVDEGFDYDALQTERPPGLPQAGRPQGRAIREMLWEGPVRALKNAEDPIRRMAGEMIERRNNIARSLKSHLTRRAGESLATIDPTDSAAVYDELNGVNRIQGPARPGELSQGEMAARFAQVVDNPTAAQQQAMPLRDLLNDVNRTRREAGVWDNLGMDTRAEARALELGDQGYQFEGLGGVDHNGRLQGPYYAPAQTTTDFVPWRTIPGPDRGELSSFQRIADNNPSLSIAAAERRMGGLSQSTQVGHARTGGEMENVNKSLHEIMPTYLDNEAERIANASVFGGHPTKMTIETSRGGAREFLSGPKARSIYDHMVATGDDEGARLFLNALAEAQLPPGEYGGNVAKGFARAASDIALSRAWLAQVGQLPTGAAMAGGTRQALRGLDMVNRHPVLREVFASGPQHASFTDYVSLDRAGTAAEAAGSPMALMHGAENVLRGPASYAAVPMVDDVAHEALDAVRNGRPFSAALEKQASEMGTTAQALAEEMLRDGMLSKGTWLNSVQSLTNRWQHVAGPGELPAMASHPVGRLALQYKTFGIKQSQLIKDDIIDPIFSGDASLRALGLKRAARLGVSGGLAGAGSSVAKALAMGKLPTGANILRNAFTSPTGIGGDAALLAGTALTSDKHKAERLAGQVKEIPAVGVFLDPMLDVLGARNDPGNAILGATKLAGAYDSRIPLYATPLVNMTREFLAPSK